MAVQQHLWNASPVVFTGHTFCSLALKKSVCVSLSMISTKWSEATSSNSSLSSYYTTLQTLVGYGGVSGQLVFVSLQLLLRTCPNVQWGTAPNQLHMWIFSLSLMLPARRLAKRSLTVQLYWEIHNNCVDNRGNLLCRKLRTSRSTKCVIKRQFLKCKQMKNSDLPEIRIWEKLTKWDILKKKWNKWNKMWNAVKTRENELGF